MKKTYTAPRTKTMKVQESAVICASPDCMTLSNDLGDGYEDAYAW